MADPLSITASVVTVTAAGFKISTTLYTLVETLRNAKTEVELIANEISVFSQVLEFLGEYLVDTKERLLRKGRVVRRSFSIKNLLWVLRREQLRPMRFDLECLKSTLLLMLQMTKLGKHCKDSKRM